MSSLLTHYSVTQRSEFGTARVSLSTHQRSTTELRESHRGWVNCWWNHRWLSQLPDPTFIPRCMVKPTKWPVRPVKTQISQSIHPVWSVFAVRSMFSCGQRRLIRLGGSWPGWFESWLGTQVILLVLSCGGSNDQNWWTLSVYFFTRYDINMFSENYML